MVQWSVGTKRSAMKYNMAHDVWEEASSNTYIFVYIPD